MLMDFRGACVQADLQHVKDSPGEGPSTGRFQLYVGAVPTMPELCHDLWDRATLCPACAAAAAFADRAASRPAALRRAVPCRWAAAAASAACRAASGGA